MSRSALARPPAPGFVLWVRGSRGRDKTVTRGDVPRRVSVTLSFGATPGITTSKRRKEMTTTTNGRARPTLATQIDRLDRLLDGLSENLTEAVADAVRAAVVQAVQTVLTEILTNPAVLTKLRDALPPSSPPKAAV